MRRVVLVLFLLVLAQAPSARAQSASGPAALTVGDYWNHRSETITGPTSNVEVSHLEVVAPEHVVVENVSYEALRTQEATVIYNNVTLSGTTHYVNSTTWLRPTDQAVIQSRTTSQSAAGSSDATTIYTPPCPDLQFPLTVGKNWTTTCTSKSGSDTSVTTTNYTVLKFESVKVPAGTFDAYRIQYVNGDLTLDFWYAPKACHAIKTQVVTPTSTQITEMTSYACAATAPATPTPTPTPTPTVTPTGTPSVTPTATPSVTPTTTPTPSSPVTTPTDAPTPESPTARTPGAGAGLVAMALAGAAFIAARRR